jgi:ribosomal protein S18 acetylase RimI-like enzyme
VVALIGGFRDHLGLTKPEDAALAEGVARLLGDAGTEFLLAFVGGRAVGCAQVRYRFSLWTGAGDAFLEDLFVAPEARRRGVATALIGFVEERARARGCLRVDLDTNEGNLAALALYDRLGYRYQRAYGGGERQYYLRKELPPG